MYDACVMTVTSDRPVAVQLLKKYLARQSFAGHVLWVVVDDGREQADLSYDFPSNISIEHRRLGPAGSAFTSFRKNMSKALSSLPAPYTVIMEDDEWYGPRWVEAMVSMLDGGAKIAGETRAIYYNVRARLFRRWNNLRHASMCQTAFRSDMAPDLLRHMSKNPTVMLDKVFWKHGYAEGKLVKPFNQCVGIKGVPGKNGIGTGHRPRVRNYKFDPDCKYLRGIIGDADAVPYMAMYDPMNAGAR